LRGLQLRSKPLNERNRLWLPVLGQDFEPKAATVALEQLFSFILETETNDERENMSLANVIEILFFVAVFILAIRLFRRRG